jgi:plasmid stability protein
MDTKLTLKLDKNVIEKAKIYAAQQKRSLSDVVENYLKAVTSMEKTDANDEIIISEFVKSISIGNGEIPADFDYKKARQDYLIEKYK